MVLIVDEEVRADVVDEDAELLDPVLERGAGHEQGAVGAFEECAGVLRALRVGVLDVMRFVDDDRGEALLLGHL